MNRPKGRRMQQLFQPTDEGRPDSGPNTVVATGGGRADGRDPSAARSRQDFEEGKSERASEWPLVPYVASQLASG